MQAEDHPESWPMGRLLGAASRAVERRWARALESHGLTHAGVIVLHLLTLGVTSQTTLAKHAHVEVQTMSRTVDRLERDGLVTREQDAADRRRHIVAITDAGRTAYAESYELERTLLPHLENEDAVRAALVRILADEG
ncbi:MarR family transcriptional regulator [Planctomonas sp. JC2975]|uniref:MarR family winged helix-turn-helix transcriptional regulator n=1 Tax=Planctomonas sp. JC2975 TaxID=2729626 RepID=UPI001F103703|nr:MarR family transcriptional regulator [Planctomonas sp. JC2975]